ncbi:MAG: acetyl-CoA carboxylase biotin carboxyl carrier protein [Burkholderiales bacterium]
MADKFDSLTDEDVRQIGLLIEILERSSFDYLQLDTGHLKVIVGKGAPPPEAHAAPAAPPAAALPAPAPVAASATQARAAPAPAQSAAAISNDEGVVAITAPMIGRFYAQPEPGAAPFVNLGTAVSAGATVGLIEVMKVFTAVEAAVSGVICEICVQDGTFVEFGSVLFRMKQLETASANSAGSAAPAKARAKR